MEQKFIQGDSPSTRRGKALAKVCPTISDSTPCLTRSCPKLLHIYSPLAQAIVRPSACFKLCSGSHRLPYSEWVVPALGPHRYAVYSPLIPTAIIHPQTLSSRYAPSSQINNCQCSTVSYSVISACGMCQSGFATRCRLQSLLSIDQKR